MPVDESREASGRHGRWRRRPPARPGVGPRTRGRRRAAPPSAREAVPTPIFTAKHSFCGVFQDLQDFRTFAPLETQVLTQRCKRQNPSFGDISLKRRFFCQVNILMRLQLKCWFCIYFLCFCIVLDDCF